MIYLDHSATTKPFQDVITSFVKVSEIYFANPSSLHQLGSQSEQLLTQSRNQTADLLNVNSQEIIFIGGGTEGNNLAVKGTALQYKSRGNHIITTQIEHPSVSEACKQLEELGFEITYLPVDSSGFIRVEDVENAIRESTILISIIHVNNEVGTIQPIIEIGQLLKKYPKILFHVDHVQGVGKVPLSIKEAGIDLCTLSAHKFNGLKGNGILFVKKGVKLFPLLAGGEQELRFRSGTENVAGIVAMTKALRLTLENQKEAIKDMHKMKQSLMDELLHIPLITINTPLKGSAPHIINFSINGLKSEVFVHLLEEKGIIVSTTSACSSKKKAPSKTLLAMYDDEKLASSAIRISLSRTNQLSDVPYIMSAIKESLEKLGKVMNK